MQDPNPRPTHHPRLQHVHPALLHALLAVALICAAAGCGGAEATNAGDDPAEGDGAGADTGGTDTGGTDTGGTDTGGSDTGGTDTGSTDTGGSDTGGDTTSGDTTGGDTDGTDVAGADPRPLFSFFATSMNGLLAQKYGDAIPSDTSEAGYGGNLGGLEGADALCAALAQVGSPGDTKTWRAFLSTHPDGPGEAIDAIDRVGDGPWYDWNGRVFAMNKEELFAGDDGRPAGADPQLAALFSDEYGNPIQINNEDNHDFLTGTGLDGKLKGSLDDTCQNWTFEDRYDVDKEVAIGHAWPRAARGGGGGGGRPGGVGPGGAQSGQQWMSDHTVNGCMPGVHIGPGAGRAEDGDQRAGGAGGFGGFYCFALSN